MLGLLYKRILRKLGLSAEELRALRDRLQVGQVCEGGQFIDGTKMCPNTHPVAILKKVNLVTKRETKEYLKEHGISALELLAFYVLYDIPAILSRKLLSHRLTTLRKAINEMVR